MNNIYPVCAPEQNACVMASAGTGKTWLLITRIIRLLMAGVPPDAILAITFTRKAAAEMRARLDRRLLEFLSLDDPALSDSLNQLGINVTDESCDTARGLYEKLLYCERQIQITTFHAFCQNILRRFPVEADVPPGFEILDNNGLIIQEAWDALLDEVSEYPDDDTGTAFELLMNECSGIVNTRCALNDFLHHRSDWWAYIDGQDDPCISASNALAKKLNTIPDQDPYDGFFTEELQRELQEFAGLLTKHNTKTNSAFSHNIKLALDTDIPLSERIQDLKKVFIKTDGNPRARKESAAQTKSLGASGQKRFLELGKILSDKIISLQERENRHLTMRITTAWYIAGNRFIEHYQRIKTEQRLLDFTDLEWKTYQLLNHSNNAHWVQYKLDQRIDHILIDEFQDTNPTQWHMILPLLQELAAGEHERKRSVFLVGDIKQSIYQFRRADPQLFENANQWIGTHFNALQYPLDMSWRSAPIIIDFINKIFEHDADKMLASFRRHSAKHQQLWGRVELLPLLESKPKMGHTSAQQLRNPLHQPRIIDEDQRHYDEGKLIGNKIQELMNNKTMINHAEYRKLLTYNDIIVLARARTHVHAYEKAFRELNIPYIGGSRVTLLDFLEIQDIVALLEVLVTPYNNLSLAKVLRSPLFDCNDSDLIRIARYVMEYAQNNKKISWFDSLEAIASTMTCPSIKYAYDKLNQWRTIAGKLPVHDLLDRIFTEGNVMALYESAFPDHLKPRVCANLSRFIELALEVDSGRYPSLPYFLTKLGNLHSYTDHAIDEPPVLDRGSAVRIMTIHAAKGLESPVVFVADTTHTKRRYDPYQALIDWPSTTNRPGYFTLLRKKTDLDNWSKSQLEKLENIRTTEETNLLYVALTRARQLLYISGTMSGKDQDLGWYGTIATRITDNPEYYKSGVVFESGQMPDQSLMDISLDMPQAFDPEPGLAQPLFADPIDAQTMPAQEYPETIDITDTNNMASELRGNAIHRMLELMTADPKLSQQDIRLKVADELVIDTDDEELDSWWHEASTLIQDPKLQAFFNPENYVMAYNEVPVQYLSEHKLFTGIIDRLIITNDQVIILDYKSHRNLSAKNITKLANIYSDQINAYSRGIEEIYPGKEIRACLLFTANASLHEIKKESNKDLTLSL